MELRKVALTISPPDRKGPPVGLYRNDIIAIFEHLLTASNDFEIYPEFADNGRLHYHGIVTIKDLVKWYKKCLPSFKQYGFICVKNNPDDKWSEYIKKNWLLTKDILNITGPLDPTSLRLELTKRNEKLKLLKTITQNLEVNKVNTRVESRSLRSYLNDFVIIESQE